MDSNKKKAAVFIINSLQNGGAERVVVNLALKLKKTGMHVIIILIHDKRYYEIPNDVQVITLSKENHGIKKVLNIFPLSRKLSAVLKEINNKYNIVLMTANLAYTHWICRFSKYKNKMLFVMHNPQFQFKHSKSKLFKLKMKLLYSNLKLVAVSKGVRNELIDIYKLNPNNIYTIYNPINFDEINLKLKENTKLSINSPFILAAGRLTSGKRFDRLIVAYKKSNIYEKYNLVILGIGEKEQELKDLSRKLGLQNRVLFIGWSNNIYKWMKKASLFVCSSDYEAFGMTIIEAFYCKCKVVSTNCKYGPAELLTAPFSKYLSQLNSDDLAKKILLALHEYPTISKEVYSQFSADKILDKYLKVYEEI
ncbi:glycosyltransferase [Lactobacillus crispatus]|uniref:glycosyltransferase n=1 Tax=Lactobacillus crispatus TaxID=47770 RepID=UPI00123ABCC5|nr:glycosyltransferase [Lactobacillus crispatus]KAA8808144.1 glycosyltransferase [Lactobacillus crispatus]